MAEEGKAALVSVASAMIEEMTHSITAPALDTSAVKARAEELVAKANAANPPLEAKLKYLADVNDGTMRGLEFKIKPLSSLVRKMTKMYIPGMTIDDLCEVQYDVLRYTIELPKGRYVTGFQQVVKELEDVEKCSAEEIKNYWDCVTYRGINCIFRTDTGVKFELQFHTPESFDQKQNKTHLLYEVLRRETDAVKQNIFFSDMMAMWDMVHLPDGVKELGTLRHQPMPERKVVNDAEQEMIDRVWGVKQRLRDHILVVRENVQKADPFVSELVQYAATLFGCSIKERDNRFKATLKMRRKVEQELRRKIGYNVYNAIHEVKLPEVIDGLPLDDYCLKLCNNQADALLYRIACDDVQSYAKAVVGTVDIFRANGFKIESVANYWTDLEKHHGINVTCEIPIGHRVLSPCKFQLEFHTNESYDCLVERRTALVHIEETMYDKGEIYNKTAADMQVRFDATMMRHWSRVELPPGAQDIGIMREVNPNQTTVETETLSPWLTPSERAEKRQFVLTLVSVGLAGCAIGFAASSLLRR